MRKARRLAARLVGWRHRHVTLERYELALEEQPAVAARLRAQARDCPGCAAGLGQPGLAPALARWKLQGAVDQPVDWRAAFRRAIAPTSRRPQVQRLHLWRLPAVAVVLAGILLGTALPAAATARPNSKLFVVRGWEEDAHWSVTPEPDRALFDAELASAYLWQARMSAGYRERADYEASMARFFKWGAHLKTDIRKAPPSARSRARASAAAAMSLVSGLAASGPDAAEARSAESLLNDVEGESQQGDDHQQGTGSGGGSQGQGQTGSAGTGDASQAGEQRGDTSGGAGPGGAQDGP
jgi:hypothetical protein